MNLTKAINFINYLSHLILFDEDREFRKKVVKKNKEKNNFYDYGNSFFYQSMPCINLKGLRDTEKRIKKLNFKDYTKDKTILDIGTNIGGILLNIEENYREAIGIEYNPKLIAMADMIKNYKKKNKLKFICSDFLTYKFDKSFDIILSLANHHTFDKGITNSLLYFDKIKKIISSKGILFLESHPSLYENPLEFERLANLLKDNFTILNKGTYDFGNVFDNTRRFYVLQKI